MEYIITSLPFSLLFLSHCVVGETFHIVTSSVDVLCPGESTGESCLTLQQYATNFSNSSQDSNVTLELDSGNHNLNSTIFAVNPQGSFSMTGNNATVHCHHSTDATWLRFDELQNVQISGITFIGCGEIRIDTVERFILENSHFLKSGPLYVLETSNASIVTSSFSGGHAGALDVRDSSVEVKQSMFSNNRREEDIFSYQSNLTIDQSTFKNNNRSSISFFDVTYRGTRTSMLRILNSNFSGNTAKFSGVCDIYFSITSNSTVSNSVITISGSNFNNNTGGAVYIRYGSFELVSSVEVSRVVTIDQSSFTNNKRGAVDVRGDNVTVFVHQSGFTNNTRTFGDGGALYVSGMNSSLSVDQSNFTGNAVNLISDGGAVFIRVNGTNRFHECSFINNTAGGEGRSSGGAIYSSFGYANNSISIDVSTFVHNSAGSCGVLGASSTDNVHITESTFTYNRAGRHGGVFCGRTMTIVRSNFSYNSAQGGGVLSGRRGDVTILESSFNYNTAEDLGGVLSDFHSPAKYKITQSSFTSNLAGDAGGVLYMTDVSRSGISQVTIEESIFTFNHANNGGGVIAVSNGNTLEINETFISNNTACLGGAISACNNVSVSLLDTELFQVSLSGTELSRVAPSIDQACSFYESTPQDGNIITGNPFCVIAETTTSAGVPDSEIITPFRSRTSHVVIIVSVYASVFLVGVIGLFFLLMLFVISKLMTKKGEQLQYKVDLETSKGQKLMQP